MKPAENTIYFLSVQIPNEIPPKSGLIWSMYRTCSIAVFQLSANC